MPKPAFARPSRKSTSDYLTKLQSPKWQKIRLKVFERAEWMCQACGSEDNTLTVHHGYYRYGADPQDLPLGTLWCMCATCHSIYQRELSFLKFAIGLLHPLEYLNAIAAIQTLLPSGVYLIPPDKKA